MTPAGLLAVAEHHEAELKLRAAWWRAGYAAGKRARAGDYAAGYAAAIADFKRAGHDTHRLIAASAPTWAAHQRALSRDAS